MRWLCVAAVLLAVLGCLETSGAPRRRLGARASSVTSAVRRGHRQLLRRTGVAGNIVSSVRRNGAHAKKLTKKEYLAKLRQKQRRGRKQRISKKRLSKKKDVCLFKALRRCGKRVIKNLSPTPGFNKRCATKERFLDCMSMMQERPCNVRGFRRGPSRRLVKQYQSRLQTLLTTARGCVIGVDLMAQSAD